jgi:hypothetical protein
MTSRQNIQVVGMTCRTSSDVQLPISVPFTLETAEFNTPNGLHAVDSMLVFDEDATLHIKYTTRWKTEFCIDICGRKSVSQDCYMVS